ncbi:DNA topoisomerase IB [Sphingobacterium sp. SGG-5]|uniref:DNA topoisomerase IB n=1 Tax=Sphingobacterium sp. SGG-5 TaxID=2710881 RepID=UPI0013EAEB85|nr:DNA topoisomerase IB [Sphingobacterium sp. SGG-5]NGM61507.1 DNA topoisomerase IB [Sphingobacterium sp. SGG-5]
MVNTAEIIADSHLVYVSPEKGGIYRKGTPGKFNYEDDKGNNITAESELERIQSLVLPPAWKNVWISPKRNGYLQAVGIDAAGRKQYRYHPDWVKRRSQEKYFRLLEFGQALPSARKQVEKDLRRRELDERKVLAICVKVLQETLIRIGSSAYEKIYNSYGLSTLKDKHFKEKDKAAYLCFVGKKGVKQEVKLTDKRLTRLVKKCKDIPGQELFQFYTEENERRAIESGMINQYIREITNDDFTAKDFRTWGGTLEAMRQLAICTKENPEMSAKKLVVEALDCVAAKLGNTRAVCKSAYVYPILLEAFEDGNLQRYLKRIAITEKDEKKALRNDEAVLIQFLKAVKRKK